MTEEDETPVVEAALDEDTRVEEIERLELEEDPDDDRDEELTLDDRRGAEVDELRMLLLAT